MPKTLPKLFLVAFLLAVHFDGHAEIPEWYERAVSRFAAKADSIVLYKTESISFVSRQGHHYVYRLDTYTIEILKGTASAATCYYMGVEGPWDFEDSIGEIRLAMLAEPDSGSCRLIEVGHSAPGTDEYVQLFKDVLSKQSMSES